MTSIFFLSKNKLSESFFFAEKKCKQLFFAQIAFFDKYLFCNNYFATIFSPKMCNQTFFFFAKMVCLFLLTFYSLQHFLFPKEGEKNKCYKLLERFFVSCMWDFFIKSCVLLQFEWSQFEFFLRFLLTL